MVSLDKNTFPSKGCNCDIHCNDNFTKDTFLIHPTVISFLTAMEVNDTCLNIKLSILVEGIVENLLRETTDPIPFGPGHWQGNNNMGNNVSPHNPHSIIMEGGKEYIKIQPFIAPIHNNLTSANAKQIVHTLMGNFCHGDKDKISQIEDMGNDACLLMGYHNEVRCARLCQVILVMNKFFLAQVSIFRDSIPITIDQLT